ncbi:MAG TPA: hypothetical protein VGQ00_03565 [Candidatus Norongarragalinales archaeon]|jgi:hypothetical protein|nr:hypothetical protein [Candidatus Norongarragalinales archaeon]
MSKLERFMRIGNTDVVLDHLPKMKNPALIVEALGHDSILVRDSAASRLKKLEPLGHETVQKLARYLRDLCEKGLVGEYVAQHATNIAELIARNGDASHLQLLVRAKHAEWRLGALVFLSKREKREKEKYKNEMEEQFQILLKRTQTV